MKYRIEQDMDAQSPAEYSDLGVFIVAKHRDFYVPAPGEKRVPEYANEVVDKYKHTHWVFPMEAYIHSGVHLSLSGQGNYPDRRWDVSQVGFVFVSMEEFSDEKKAREVAKAHLEMWNQYNCGDVWGYVVEDDDGNELDACWGFYGHEYCDAEAKRVIEHKKSIVA